MCLLISYLYIYINRFSCSCDDTETTCLGTYIIRGNDGDICHFGDHLPSELQHEEGLQITSFIISVNVNKIVHFCE